MCVRLTKRQFRHLLHVNDLLCILSEHIVSQCLQQHGFTLYMLSVIFSTVCGVNTNSVISAGNTTKGKPLLVNDLLYSVKQCYMFHSINSMVVRCQGYVLLIISVNCSVKHQFTYNV